LARGGDAPLVTQGGGFPTLAVLDVIEV